MFRKILHAMLLAVLAVTPLTNSCKRREKEPEKAKIDDNLPQPADLSGVPRFKWSMTQTEVTDVLRKNNIKPNSIQRRYLTWESAFDDPYYGRVTMSFEGDEEHPRGPIEGIDIFLWPGKVESDTQKQRQAMFDYWSAKLAKRYGTKFKTEQTERTKSQIWELRPDFTVEIRLVTAQDTSPQLGIYWVRKVEEKDEDEEEREREEEEQRERKKP